MKFHFPTEKPDVEKHLIGIFVSLVIHFFLAIVMIRLFSSVKIIDFGTEVTDVIIGPSEKLSLPPTNDLPEGLDEYSWGFLERKRGRTATARKVVPEWADTIETEKNMERSGDLPMDPKFVSGFNLEKLQEGSKAVAPGQSQPFTLPSKQRPSEIGKYSPKPPGKEIDFRRYLSPGSPGSGSISQGYPSRGRKRGASLRTQTSSTLAQTYDLTPWAGKVVEILMRNWPLPPPEATRERDRVEILLTILKNGDFIAIEVIDSSANSVFDQAALDAIQASSQFFSLPDDFPGSSLDIFLVFSKE